MTAPRELKTEVIDSKDHSPATKELKDIVVVGGGPIGLYAAIKLKQQGVKNVVVLDSRAGEYTRAGGIDRPVLMELMSELYDLRVMSPKEKEFKDLKPDTIYFKAQHGALVYSVLAQDGKSVNTGIISEDQLGIELEDSKNSTDELLNKRKQILSAILEVTSNNGHTRAIKGIKKQVHIKDIERNLLEIAQSMHIDIQKMDFKTFHDKTTMEIADKEGVTKLIPCDLAIDCTGSKRAVADEVNQLHTKASLAPPFEKKQIADNPTKSHFLAYIRIDESDFRKIIFPRANLEALEKLKTQFNWDKFNEPFFRAYDFGKNKVALYYETPADLKKEDEIPWFRALVYHKTGLANFAFEVEPSKKYKKRRFNKFNVDPHEIVRPLFMGNDKIPMVLIAGDAHLEPEYRLGMGIESGAERFNAFLKSIKVSSEGNINDFNIEQFRPLLQELTDQHKQKIAVYYQKLQKKSAESLQQLLEYYSDFYKQITILDRIIGRKHEQEKKLPMPENMSNEEKLKIMSQKISAKLYENAIKSYKKLLDDKGNINDNSFETMNQIDEINETRDLFIKALRWEEGRGGINQSQIDKIMSGLGVLAEKLIIKARKPKTTEEHQRSATLYKKALDIYLAIDPQLYAEQIGELFDKLIFVANKLGRHSDVIFYTTRGLDYFQEYKLADSSMYAKIMFDQTNRLLEQAKHFLPRTTKSDLFKPAKIDYYSKKQIHSFLSDAEKNLLQLKDNNNISDKDYHTLYDKFLNIATKFEFTCEPSLARSQKNSQPPTNSPHFPRPSRN